MEDVRYPKPVMARERCYPIEDFHYGMREFAIFDNNGYLLQFGQPLARKEVES